MKEVRLVFNLTNPDQMTKSNKTERRPELQNFHSGPEREVVYKH